MTETRVIKYTVYTSNQTNIIKQLVLYNKYIQ